MESFNAEIIEYCLIELKKSKKGCYLENIKEICSSNFNMDENEAIEYIDRCIELKHIAKNENRFGKESFSLIKDKNEDAISYIENMYEETKYRELKESLLTDIRKDIKDMMDHERRNSNQIDYSVSSTSHLENEIKKQQNKIRELDERLIKKDDIIFLLAN